MKLKRLLSLFLCMVLLVSNLAVAGYATENETAVEEAVTEVDVAEEIPEQVMAIGDGDLGTGTPDGTPPVLHSITLSVTTVKAPGTIEVTMDASDDVSGVKNASVHFYCEETGKYLSCRLYPTYRDEETWEQVPYADGKLRGEIEVDQYVVSGKFEIRELSIFDVAGNEAYYYSFESDFANEFPDPVKNLQFCVMDEDKPDGIPPVLHNVTLSVTTVKAPGTIEVTMDASDDVSGVKNASVHFYCDETGKYLSCRLYPTYRDEETWEQVPYADGKLRGEIEVDQYVVSGKFEIRELSIFDVAGNEAYYYSFESDFANELPEFVKNLHFTVVEFDTADGTPPMLNDVKLVVDTMAAPGTIEVIMDASDDVSGVKNASVHFYCEETGKYLSCRLYPTYRDEETWEQVPYADGKLRGEIEIDQYVVSGMFKIRELSIFDVAGNEAYYYSFESDFANELPDSVKNLQFTVLNAIPDVTTSVSKSEFVEQLEEAKDDAYIVADYSGNATLPEEAFEAIAGTDKTVDLVSEGVTWRFNGEDITKETKDIDLSVKITKAEEETSASGQEIKELLDDSAAVVLKFAENGELPGKATIQVKVDYAMREYLGSGQKLYVYYYNNQTGKLELVAEDLTVVNDTYVEFAITHCSYYVLTATKAEEKPEVKPEDKPEVKPVEFKDVPTDAFFYDAVMWAVGKGVTTGTSATTFSPDAICNRGQVVTFLWRAAGQPEPTKTENPFKDVKSGDFFYKAVLWAAEQGITTGTSETTFSPNENCNRGQIVTFLSRAKGGKATTSTNPFKDVAENAFYYNPVLWAVEKGITAGTGDGTTFEPNAACTRGQVITFLYRAYK